MKYCIYRVSAGKALGLTTGIEKGTVAADGSALAAVGEAGTAVRPRVPVS